jgi:hypothetical protein
MLYVQLDTNWPDNHKIIDAGVDGAGAHAIVLCLAKRLEHDGWVRRPLLARYGVDGALLDRLVDLELLESDGVNVRPWDWHSRNPSQPAIDAKREAKVRAGKAGNHERYGHPGDSQTCRTCYPETVQKPSVLAPATRKPSQTARTPLAPPSSPTSRGRVEGEVEVTTAIAPARPGTQPARDILDALPPRDDELNHDGINAAKAALNPTRPT